MADFDYSEFVTLAQEMIRDFGRDVGLIREGTRLRDPSKPYKGSVPLAPVTARAVFVGKGDADWGQVGISPDLFVNTDKVCLVAVEPSVDMRKVRKIEDEGEVWSVAQFERLKPGPTEVLFFFGLKREGG